MGIDGYVGVDLSLTSTGLVRAYSRLADGRQQWHADSKLFGKIGITTTSRPLHERLGDLRQLAAEIVGQVETWLPRVICVEAPAFSSSRSGTIERGWLWSEVVWQLLGLGTVQTVTPQQLKIYATGKGVATKGAVVDAVARRWPVFMTGGNDNLADAAVLAALAADLGDEPMCDMPKSSRRAIDLMARQPKRSRIAA